MGNPWLYKTLDASLSYLSYLKNDKVKMRSIHGLAKMSAHLQVSFTVLGHKSEQGRLSPARRVAPRRQHSWRGGTGSSEAKAAVGAKQNRKSAPGRGERYTNIRNLRQSRRGEAAARVPDRYYSSFYSISMNFHRHHHREASRIATNE